MSFNTFYLNSELSSGVIDGSNVIIGGNLGISTNNPQHNLDVSGTINTINLIAYTATISELDISGETIKATSIQTKVESTEVVILDVNVSSKTSNAFNSSGSSNAYFINNIESPFIHLTSGKTYRFNQSDSTNNTHPIKFYLDEGKSSQYSTNITTNGTANAGSLGDYVEITITSSTPQILYYQCQNHSFMGGKIYVKGTNVTSITSVGTLTAGTWNASTIQKQYLDTQNISVNDLSDISFNPTSTTNGQALVWNTTDKVWEAGVVAGSGGGGLTDLSATSISDLSDVSFNSATTTNGQALVWNTTDNIWEPGTVASSSSNTTNVMSLNPGDFKVLEKIAGICDGRTISGESIGHVLKNVTTYQDISTTLVDVEGSSISYTPPNNAKQVLYNFRFNVVDISDEANVFNQNHTLTLRLYIDGVEITNQRAQISSYMYNHGHYFNYAAIIDIGSVDSDNVESGKYVSWTSDKVIKLAASKSHGDYPARLFSIKMVSSGSYVHTFVPPSIELASIGDVSDISFSAISIADLSDVSFNSTTTTNGQALVWNTTDKVWEAGVVAGSGGGGLTDLSATSMTDLSDVSFNPTDISDNQPLTWNSTNKYWEPSTTVSVDTISEKTDGSGVTIDSVLLKDNNVTAHTVTAQNYAVGGTNFISASRQGNFRDIEVKNNVGNSTIILSGGTNGVSDGDISITGILSTGTISEYTSGTGVTIDSVLLKDQNVTAHTISAQNYAVGGTNFISASRQGNFRDIEVKNNVGNSTIILSGGTNGVSDGDISITGTLSTDAISEYTSGTGVTINSVLMKNGDLSANDASFNVIDVSAIIINGVDLISGAPAALDTLNELAAALDNSANFAANVTAQLAAKQGTISSSARLNADLIHDGTISNTEYGYLNGVTSAIQTQLDAKQATLTAGTNITINGTTISSSGGGGLTDLSATSISDLSDVSLNGIQVNQSLKWDGEKLVPYTLATTATSVTKQGQVLETVAGVCDGRSVTVESGTYTLENITTGTKIDESSPNFIDFPGSSITYKPPPGTRQVYYSFKFSLGRYDNHTSMGYKFFIDGTEVTSFKRYDGVNGNYGQGFLSFDCVIEIGGTNDILNGKLSSWNTLKILKVQVAQEDEHGVWLNKSLYDIQQGNASNNADTSHNSSTYVRKPSLKLEAIGESSGQAVTLTTNSINDLSDISFNTTSTTDGQALVWNTTDKVWEAGVVAGSGGGGLTDLSATSISDLSDVSLNGIQVNQSLKWDGEKLIPFTPGTTATSITKQGQVLETLAGVCDGRSVTVESGTYTLPNVTQKQEISNDTTYEDLTGSNILYKPPSGTKQIIYKMVCQVSRGDGGGSQYIGMAYRLYIDGVQCGQTKHINNYEYGDGYLEFEYVIDIGTNDMTNGKISSWTTNKTMKLMCIERDSSSDAALHISSYNSEYGESNSEVMKPHLEIIAIGESSGQAVTLTNNSINDLSDISFNPTSTTDGQALVWNSTDSVWEAGAVASSGSSIDETTDVSLNDLSVHGDISGSVSSFIKFGETQTTQTNNKLYSWVVDNSGTFDISHIGYQSSGSEGTNWPKSRQGHSNIFDNSNNIIIFGGKDSGNNHLSNIWEYNIGTNTYTKKVSTMQTGGSSGIKPDYSTDNTWLPYENLTAMGYPNERSDNRSLAAFDDKLYWLSDTQLWVKDLTASVSNPSTAGNTNWSQVTGITGTSPNNGKRGSFFHYNYDGTDYLYYLHGVWDDDTSPESGDFNTSAFRFNISTKTWTSTSASNSTIDYKRMYAAYHVYDGYCFSYGGNVNGSNYSNTFVKTGLGGSGDKAFGYCTTLSPSVEGGNSITGRTYVSWAGQGQYMYVIGGRASNGNAQKCIFRFDCANTTYRQITSTSDSIVGKLHWEEGVATIYDNKIIMASSYNAGTSGATNYILSVDISTISNSYSLAYYPDGSNQTDASRRINTEANNSVGAAAAFVLYKNRWYFMFPYGTGINSDGSYSNSVDYSNGYGGGRSPYMWTYVFSDYNSIAEHNLINHTSNLHNDNMYIFGGKNNSNSYKNNLIKVLLSNYTYSLLTLTSSLPSIRDSHSSVILNDKMYIFGGWDGSTVNNETWEIDLSVDPPASTQKLSNVISSTNINLYGHSAVIYDNNMYIFGGYNGNTLFNNIYKYDITNNSWSLLNTNGTSPSARYYHTAIVTKDEMIVYGGKNTSNITIQDSYLFDFNNNTWYLLNNDVATTHTQTSTSIPNYSFGSKALHYNSGNDYKIYLYGGYNSQNTTLIGGNGIIHTSDISHNLTEYTIVESGNAFTFNINSDGRVGIGKQNPTKKLDVGGDGIFSGTVTSNGSILTSDDRIKHNEERITNALSTISKITPKHYFKTSNKLYDSSHNFILNTNNEPVTTSNHRLTINEDYTIETGIIAQEIQNIPELRFAIQNTIPLGIDYNSIHCTHIAATNELHQLVKTQQTEIEQQQQEIENLKLVNQDLNNQFNQFIQELQNIKQHLGI